MLLCKKKKKTFIGTHYHITKLLINLNIKVCEKRWCGFTESEMTWGLMDKDHTSWAFWAVRWEVTGFLWQWLGEREQAHREICVSNRLCGLWFPFGLGGKKINGHRINRNGPFIPQSTIFLMLPGILFYLFLLSIVDVQCCVSFRYTAKWFSYT